MKKLLLLLILIGIGLFSYRYLKDNEKEVTIPTYNVSGTILSYDDNYVNLTNEDGNFKVKKNNIKENIGTEIMLTCKGIKEEEQKCEVTEYKVLKENEDLFSDYYDEAQEMLKKMTLDEKIGQLLLVRYYDNMNDIIIDYHIGGVIYFEKDFKNKTKEAVIEMIKGNQEASAIPLLTAIDEEGGKVSRLSSNKNIVSTPFLSPQDLYKKNGFTAIEEDVKNKSAVLNELGLNLNLAPVVDVSTNPKDYIYNRTLGLDTNSTMIYAETVIKASKDTNVSYTLKHFPGYGNNLDTHVSSSISNKSLEDIMTYDLPPFKSGIEAGAEAVMVSHNIITSIDKDNPSSLSKNIHDLLKNNLNFTGITITDDLSMGALKNIGNVDVKSLLAGNDILITSDYKTSFNNIKLGVENNIITEDNINDIVMKILAWKYYKKLL